MRYFHSVIEDNHRIYHVYRYWESYMRYMEYDDGIGIRCLSEGVKMMIFIGHSIGKNEKIDIFMKMDKIDDF